MATIDNIIQRAEDIRDEITIGANTATRVGSVMVDTADHVKTAEEDIATNASDISDLQYRQTQDGDTILRIGNSLNDILDVIQDLEGDDFYITDGDGNVIMRVDKDGLESVEVSSNGRKLSDAPLSMYDDFYITDGDGNVILKVDKDGLSTVAINNPKLSDWHGLTIACYGDSVVARTNGDFIAPFELDNINWGKMVGKYFNMGALYGRGIVGQAYDWDLRANGGSVAWVSPTGATLGFILNQNYNNWDGVTYPAGVTAEMEQQGDAIRIRGSLCSWMRITNSFPVSIKDEIDVILVMAHNDGNDDNVDCAFVANSTTDPEWSASGVDYYGKINGDYNITTMRGGIASTIMKLQLWMPNAVIVLMTGISGEGTTGELNMDINVSRHLQHAEIVREMAKLVSVPCIDTFEADGINGWNRLYYIADDIHPNNTRGNKMFSRAVIGGMKNILPKEKII